MNFGYKNFIYKHRIYIYIYISQLLLDKQTLDIGTFTNILAIILHMLKDYLCTISKNFIQ